MAASEKLADEHSAAPPLGPSGHSPRKRGETEDAAAVFLDPPAAPAPPRRLEGAGAGLHLCQHTKRATLARMTGWRPDA
jgi:hypothetical protein